MYYSIRQYKEMKDTDVNLNLNLWIEWFPKIFNKKSNIFDLRIQWTKCIILLDIIKKYM
jgi:hypothetical protein